ncbi:Carbonic anhydrase or acetyltransferase, isoleucine patch superfamily [Bacillus sp. OV322]|uniref:gamma carbonic anhydrase family protein n=1 Tax=Bacillus sp. OV322 TaxID=1882764 RepID=UPI0008E1FC47|nr:gamma carbonic anhydrase family protein [Bacillus sp. OV322]SFC72026.1 Carbonic anhydrase or acetyltransferase, isoleucine patch superfamily [Bacillus sp. OV322]
MIYSFDGTTPSIDNSVFIAPGARIIGNVTIGKDSSVWFNAVLRGDEGPISIGEKCNVQDNCTLHLYEEFPLILEDEVSVGHNVILHGCHVKKGALIGMGSTIMDGAVIGEGSLIGANTFIPAGKIIPPHSLVIGSPGKVARELTEQDKTIIAITIDTYFQKGRKFKEEFSLK